VKNSAAIEDGEAFELAAQPEPLSTAPALDASVPTLGLWRGRWSLVLALVAVVLLLFCRAADVAEVIWEDKTHGRDPD
jgi:hypothetical protein